MTSYGAHTALGDGTEFDTIRSILTRLGARAGPAGDDAAVTTIGDARLAVSTDCSVEGTHFRVGWMRPDEIGWRATAAALSDLAAVGAAARGVLVALGVCREYPESFAVDLMDGAADAAAAVDTVLLGGDLFAADRVTVCVTVLGEVAHHLVGRGGSRPGDLLFVTGWLGGPRVALEALQAHREPPAWARARFVRPVPRVATGVEFRAAGVHAMIDVSDGLVADAGHLAAAGGVRCVLDLDRLPAGPVAVDPIVAAASGEEYELLLAAPETMERQLRDLAAEGDVALTIVGRVEEGNGVVTLRDGRPVPGISSFTHFG